MERVLVQAPPSCTHHQALHWDSNNQKLTVQEAQDAVGKGVEQAVAYQGGGVDAQQLHSKGAPQGEVRAWAAAAWHTPGTAAQMPSSSGRVIASSTVLWWLQLAHTAGTPLSGKAAITSSTGSRHQEALGSRPATAMPPSRRRWRHRYRTR